MHAPSRKKDELKSTQAPVSRWLVLGCGFGVMILVCSLALGGLWVVKRIGDMEQMAADARKDYRDLNVKHPFTQPVSSGGAGSGFRFNAYLRVRESWIGAINPGLESATTQLLARGDVTRVGNIKLINGFSQFVEAATRAHLDALTAEAMSPNEFFWIHGLAIRDILNEETGSPRRERLERVLGRLETIAASEAEGSAGFSKPDFLNELDEAYRGRPPLTGAMLDELEMNSTLVCLIDLLMALPMTAARIDGSGEGPEAN